MSTGWFERGVLTDRAVEICERVRMIRAVRLADDTMPIAGGAACRRSQGSWPNMAGGFHIGPALSTTEIEQIREWFREIGKDARIGVADRAGTETFANLAAAGFLLKDMVSILTMPVSDAAAEMPAIRGGGVHLRAIAHDDRAACRQLAEVLAQQFAPPGMSAAPEDIEANEVGIRHPDALAIGAFDGPRCIGGGLIDVADGVAALWGAAVDPDYRRRGVQQALVASRMAIARERGASLAFIETTSGGPTHRNAAALGFQAAYTRVLLVRH